MTYFAASSGSCRPLRELAAYKKIYHAALPIRGAESNLLIANDRIQENPLTLTLSPQGRGEGTRNRAALFA